MDFIRNFFGIATFETDSNGNIIKRIGFRPVLHFVVGSIDYAKKYCQQFKNAIVYQYSNKIFSKTFIRELKHQFEIGKSLVIICESMDCVTSKPDDFDAFIYVYNNKDFEYHGKMTKYEDSDDYEDEDYNDYEDEDYDYDYDEYDTNDNDNGTISFTKNGKTTIYNSTSEIPKEDLESFHNMFRNFWN